MKSLNDAIHPQRGNPCDFRVTKSWNFEMHQPETFLGKVGCENARRFLFKLRNSCRNTRSVKQTRKGVVKWSAHVCRPSVARGHVQAFCNGCRTNIQTLLWWHTVHHTQEPRQSFSTFRKTVLDVGTGFKADICQQCQVYFCAVHNIEDWGIALISMVSCVGHSQPKYSRHPHTVSLKAWKKQSKDSLVLKNAPLLDLGSVGK